VVAIVLGVVLSRTLFKGGSRTAFVMELPPYRMPTLKGIWFHMWERTSAFVRKAFTIILATSVIIWILMAIPVGGAGGAFADTDIGGSAFSTVSGVIAPALKPLGFGDWKAAGALTTGFVAKEVVVGTMAQIYGVEGEEEEAEPTTFLQDIGEIITSFFATVWDTIKSIPLIIGINLFGEEAEEEPTDLMLTVQEGFEASSGGHGALAAVAFLLFVLLYTPCMVAVAAERQELGSKWMWVSIIGQLILAWGVAFIVFQGGILLGLG
jgi:ferrous iron transport protein B